MAIFRKMIAVLKAKNHSVIRIEPTPEQDDKFHKIGAMIKNLTRKYRTRKLQDGVIHFHHEENSQPFYTEIL